MNVELCCDSGQWDAYVEANPRASNYHRWRWKGLIEKTYGHETFYFAAKEQGKICGVLPLAGIKSLLWGRFLVSMPFFSYGGILADTPEAHSQLAAKSEELARRLNASRIELRQPEPLHGEWRSSTAKVLMEVPLAETPEKFFNSLGSRLRNKIRSARKQGLNAEWGKGDLNKDFYRVFSCNMRNLGTPVYPRKWFENFMQVAPETTHILVIRDGKEPIAATFITTYRDRVELPWIASTPEGRKKYSSVLLYWTALEWAMQNGFRRVDLGRCTPGGGTHRFKAQWNCEEIPLPWCYWLKPGESLPQMRPDNPRFRIAVETWKRLPLGVANLIGPHIVRAIP